MRRTKKREERKGRGVGNKMRREGRTDGGQVGGNEIEEERKDK